MSDTPITDSTAHNVADLGMLCRRLERELNTANDMFKKLNIHALNLTDRIKRLEEAGDALVVLINATDEQDLCSWIDNAHDTELKWRKAKEAKP